jgi:2-oxoglutarate ferredoxin oxidoreductase subunit beta
MSEVLKRSADHRGAALVEIAQNCIIFNDATWGHITDPDKRLDNVLYLEHGKPMRFGKQGEKGIRLRGLTPEVVKVVDVGEENLLVHDEQAAEPTLAYLLSRMGPPDFPTPVGVFRAIEKPVYSQLLMEQVHNAQAARPADLDALFRQGETWDVPGRPDGDKR